jgi:hypothetical protein
VNLFPLARTGRAHVHHNPMDRFEGQRAGLFRPRVAQRIARQILDSKFDELLSSAHRWASPSSSPLSRREKKDLSCIDGGRIMGKATRRPH